jgi:hypothetical protein
MLKKRMRSSIEQSLGTKRQQLAMSQANHYAPKIERKSTFHKARNTICNSSEINDYKTV